MKPTLRKKEAQRCSCRHTMPALLKDGPRSQHQPSRPQSLTYEAPTLARMNICLQELQL